MKIKNYATLFHRLNSCLFRGTDHCNSRPSILISVTRKFSDWHIVGALCLERKPVISQLLTPLEQRYFQYLQKIEFEKSYLSEHEKKHIDDLRVADKLKKGELEDMDLVSKQTAQDFEDACLEEFKKYKPNQRTTEADLKNDRLSLQRKLDSSLVFVTKNKLGNDDRWILPQAIHQDGETLRQTAERSLREICPKLPKIQFMGNAPVGYYKYKYPKVIRGNGVCGAKVFFFKAQLREKNLSQLNIEQTGSVSDALWLTHSELSEVLQQDYLKAVQSILLPDTFDADSDFNSHYQSSEEEEPIIKTSASN